MWVEPPQNLILEPKVDITVARARPQDAEAWDEFVEEHPEGRFCHLWGFRQVLEKTYGYRCVYLNIFFQGNLIGVFPSVAITRGSGRLISQPFSEYGGPLTQTLSASQYKQLARGLLQVGEEENCRSIEIRGGVGLAQAAESGDWFKQHLHSYGILKLDEKEKLWRKSLTNEARKGVNRARKAGLTADIRRGSRAIEAPFYQLYLISMKRLGVPPHGGRFFTELAAAFGQHFVAAWIKYQGNPVAILSGLTTGKRIHIYSSVSDPKFWSMRPNDLAHWELIAWALDEGLRVFDFGPARYPGQTHFKRKWGVTFHEYNYYLIGPRIAERPKKFQTIDTASTPIQVMSKIWRWVVPVPLTHIFGPPIRKYLTK